MRQADAKIQLFGPLMLRVGDLDLTPRSAKAKAMLAMLATSPDMRRSRRWLEDKLWSDRGEEQARASLRQILSELRRLLGDHPDLLEVDRSTVALRGTTTDLNDVGAYRAGPCEFLEGIDVKDREFEEWLRDMRAGFSAPAGVGIARRDVRLVVDCRSLGEVPSASRVVGNVLADKVATHICEQVTALRRFAAGPVPHARADIDVSCEIADSAGRSVAFFRISTPAQGQIFYSRTVEIAGGPVTMIGSDEVARVAFEAAEMALQHVTSTLARTNPVAQSYSLAQVALRKMFAFEPEKLAQADRLLGEAFRLNPDPRHLAWRALIRTIQDIELFENDAQRLRREADEFITAALHSGPESSLVLALSAIVRAMLFDDSDAAEYLARTANYISPESPFSLQALAVAQMMTGNLSSAYANSLRCYNMSACSSFRHWWDVYHCLVCISCKEFEEAVAAAEAAARRAPTFRPPLRNLLALYAHFAQVERAQAVARRLSVLEPGFSIQRFISEVEYPNRTVRNAGLLGALTVLPVSSPT